VQDADGDGNPNVHGARERDFQAIVGGVSNVDPLTGLRLSELNLDSIEEIEVVATGAGVEYGRAQGGFANIIEKQGTNRFEGSFNFIYRSSALDGNGATGVSEERTPEFEWIQPAIQLSGPIVKDRAWFRISSELIDRQDPIDTLGGIATIDTRQVNNSAIITWQASRRNRLAFSYLNAPLRIENMGVDSTTPIESTSIFEFEGPTWRVGWTAPYSPRLLVESLVAFQDGSHKTLPTTTGVPNDCVLGIDVATQTRCLNTNTGLTSGTFPYTRKDKRQRLTVRTQVDYFGGRFWGADHHFKFGFAVENERYERTLDRQPDLTF
jgi:outer membrane receptor protein involved in Fe transport